MREKVVIAGMDASSPAHGHGCPFAGVDLLFHYEQSSTKHVEYMLQIQRPFPLLHFERKQKRCSTIFRMTTYAAVGYIERISIVKGKGACISNIYETCICTL